LTKVGAARFRAASEAWRQAQLRFEAAFGSKRAKELRALLHEVATHEAIAASA
jgi:hypothetical protein